MRWTVLSAARFAGIAVIIEALCYSVHGAQVPLRPSPYPAGWKTFSAPDFGMQLVMPANASRDALAGPGAAAGRASVSGEQDKTFVAVMRIDFPQGSGMSQTQVRDAIDKALDGVLVRVSAVATMPKTDVMLGDALGRQIVVENGGRSLVMYLRAYYVHGYVYMVSVTVQAPDRGSKLVPMVFDSLKVTPMK